MFFNVLTKKFFSLFSSTYSIIKLQLSKLYIFIKTHFLVILASVATITIVMYGGISYFRYLQNLRQLSKKYFIEMREKNKTDPFMDPDFINFLKINNIISPLFNKTLEELYVLYAQENKNAGELLFFLTPLWSNFDCFTKLAIKIYLVRCIENKKSFKSQFCKTFILYVKYMVMCRYGEHYDKGGDDMAFSFFGKPDSHISINDFNQYIDSCEPLYTVNDIPFNYYLLNLKYPFVDVPICVDSTIINIPYYIGPSLPFNQNVKLPIIKEMESTLANHYSLFDKNGVFIGTIEQKSSYLNFFSENISYIIQIICDMFS